ncbi:DUF6468 domain-containing protein [Methylobacterium sp. sgz302541]|uniref:DUF6468 domain-containing protein n=1 Tax=unclassified Methylobacterium TaxID=2615210 RepID=UPI003D34E235
MSLLITLAADILVAILLVATIVTSMRLSRRIAQLKGDEAALRQTIADLMSASGAAERAIGGLRAALAETDRTLAERLGTAERYAADIAVQVQAGESVLARIGAIVAQAQGRPAPVPAPAPASVVTVEPASRPAPPPAVPASPNGERLGAAAAAALAMSERALGRIRSRAA